MTEIVGGKSGIGGFQPDPGRSYKPANGEHPDAVRKQQVACPHPGCGALFEPSNGNQKYCSTHSSKQAQQERWRLRKQPEQKAAVGNVGKSRRCFQCGKDYAPASNAQRVCPDCKGKAIAPTPPKTLKDITVRKTEADPRGTPAHVPGAKLDAGKPQLSLVFGGFARALDAVAQVGTYGAAKYSPNGWQSVPDGRARYTDAMLRHLLQEATSDADADSGLSHAAHLAWNALARLELMLREANQ